jgi:type I restriction enzyme S subunit
VSWPLEDIGSHVEKITTWNPSESGLNEEFFYIDLSSVDKDKKALELSQVQKVLAKNAPSRARQLVKASDVLVSTVRPNLNGIARIPDELNDATASTGYCVLRPIKQTLNSNYLFYWVQSNLFVNDMILKATGANYPAVSDRIIKQSKIPLPPLAEQQKIASILDAADSLRQKDQQLIEKYTALSQSLFLEMFGDPKVNPNNWPLTALGKIIEEGPQNGLYKPSGDYGTGTPIIRIDSFHNSVVELSKLKRVRVSEGELSKFEIFEGDFVLNRVNSPSHLGKCGLVSKVKERMVFESNMMRIKFNKSMVNNTFMLSILSSKYLKHQILNSSKDAVNQSSINQKDVNSFEIPLPPIELQNQFAELIQAIEAQKKQAQASLEKSAALFNSLLQRAFKGELTT